MSSSASSAYWTCKKCFKVFDDEWWRENSPTKEVIENHIKYCKGLNN